MIRLQVESERDDERTQSSQQDADRSRSIPGCRGGVASIQRAIGNQAIQRQCQERGIQAKLPVNDPDDRYEREAERVADEVIRMPSTEFEVDSGAAEGINRKGTSGRAAVEGNDRQLIESAKDGGKPLSLAAQSFFEPRFGRDFSDVRVHTGSKADEAARSIDAEAFTIGRDVVFAEGKYAPETSEGRELIAHELTHVVQQRTAQSTPLVQRNDDDGEGDTNLLTDDEITEAIRWTHLRYASHGFEYVEWLQSLLTGMSDIGWSDPGIRREFVRTVAEFQDRTSGLTVDGMVGPRTLRKLWNQFYVVPNWDVAIRVIVLAFDMPTEVLEGGLEGLVYNKDLEVFGTVDPERCAAEVCIGPDAFESSFPALADTIRHELQHLQQSRQGVEDEALREFRAEAQELLNELRGAPRMRQRFHEQMADAQRALDFWNELNEMQKIQERELFLRLREEVTTRFRQRSVVPGWTFYVDILRKYLTARVPPPP